jgi:hypothetical protein
MKFGKSYVNWLKKLTFINEAFSDQQLYQYKKNNFDVLEIAYCQGLMWQQTMWHLCVVHSLWELGTPNDFMYYN